jgi:integrase
MAAARGRTAAPIQGDSLQTHEHGEPGPVATGYPGLPEAYRNFHASLVAKSPRTAENYAAALRRFDEFLRDTARTPDVMTTDQIDGRALEAFYLWLLEQRGRAAKRTAITYVAGVRAFLAFLDRHAWLAPHVSYERMKAGLRALIGRVPYPTPRIDEAIARVITYVNERPLPPATPQTRQARLTLLRDRAILTTLYGTALRRAELAGLNRADVQDGWAGEAIITGKGAKERIVFFDVESLAAIRMYLQERNDSYRPLFIRHDDGRGDPVRGGERYRLSGHYIWATVKRYGHLAGVALTTHHLRHLRARVMLNNGMSLSLLQDLLGHASPETTKRIYAQHSQAHLREAVAQFGTPAAEVLQRVQARRDSLE